MTSLSLEARSAITEVLTRYATGIDRRDWALFRTCFTDDSRADYGPIGQWHTASEITEWMDAAHREMGHTLHRLTNIVIDGGDADDNGADGNGDTATATARTYVDAVLFTPDGSAGHHAIGFYDDVLVCVGKQWQIAERVFTMAWFEPLGSSATATP